eukprot:TRINITY_DN35689_c0_g1_i1.p1 TRINITY_DN35689_c0_g1~~TRINITY_DN35689_c0_g1_i1.p1  ORF type:complete len:364 (-),score=63.76 TRINITY_DN35689_c0_g1_i1:311-1402(-)
MTTSSGAEICPQCGEGLVIVAVRGSSICQSCGEVIGALAAEGTTWLEDQQTWAAPAGLSAPQTLLRVQASKEQKSLTLQIQKAEATRLHRLKRCQAAISILSNAAGTDALAQQHTLDLVMKACARFGRVPGKGPRLKRLVSACLLIATSRMGLGLTIHEVAAHANIQINQVQKDLWRVHKACGVRVLKNQANLESLLQRICEHFHIVGQRAAVCAAASQIVGIAQKAWIGTGRMWTFVVAASFLLAAKAYHYILDCADVAKMLYISKGTIQARFKEIREVFASLLKHLPWGHMVTLTNVHAYVLFALDFYEVLEPVIPILRRQQLELEAAKAVEPGLAAIEDREENTAAATQGRKKRSRDSEE